MTRDQLILEMIVSAHGVWLGPFVIATLALNLAPGPDMTYVAARSLGQGRRAGIISAFGDRGRLSPASYRRRGRRCGCPAAHSTQARMPSSASPALPIRFISSGAVGLPEEHGVRFQPPSGGRAETAIFSGKAS